MNWEDDSSLPSLPLYTIHIACCMHAFVPTDVLVQTVCATTKLKERIGVICYCGMGN